MSTYFKSGGKINIEQLQNLGNSIKKNDNEIKKLLHIPGVLKLPDSISKNFLIEVSDSNNGYINVGYQDLNQTSAAFGGIAIDEDGNTIKIIENQSYVGSDDSNIYFDTNNPVWNPQRTDDPNLTGSGPNGELGYARNSGNYNIPITDGVINYVYIRYQEIVKQTASSSQIVSGVNYETQFEDGYVIKVTTNIEYDTNWILLGTVDATFETVSANNNSPLASNMTMQLGYLNGSIVGSPYHAMTGWSVYPTSAGEYIDLETHINALGTGIPSSTNPHGLSAADIGANVNNAGFNSVQTISAENASNTIGIPILDLSESNVVAQSYDIVIIDAENAPIASEATIRLPEASINTTAYKYTFKAAAASEDTTISLTSLIPDNATTNLIEGGTIVQYGDRYYSKLDLNISDSVTLVVGLTSTGYNWWRI